MLLFIAVLALALVCGGFANGTRVLCWVIFLLYFFLNLIYSFGGKNVPLLDIAILVSGFLLRVIYGGMVTDIPLSHWLCLTITAASFYLSLGKRRGELLKNPDNPRPVLRYYSRDFLEKNMYMSVALAIVFYALWTVDASSVIRFGTTALVWTVPLVILIFMRYSLIVEDKTDGDPVEVILHDIPLLLLGTAAGSHCDRTDLYPVNGIILALLHFAAVPFLFLPAISHNQLVSNTFARLWYNTPTSNYFRNRRNHHDQPL